MALVIQHLRYDLLKSSGAPRPQDSGAHQARPAAVRECERARNGETSSDTPEAEVGYAASLISIFFAPVFAGFGIRIRSTPFDMVASTLLGSMADGSCSTRKKTP